MKSFGLLLAAGQSLRMGPYGSKMWIVLQGRPALAWSLENFAAGGRFDGGVVVVRPEHEAEILRWLKSYRLNNWVTAPGGRDRYLSVQSGLEALRGQMDPMDVVLIHDAARILVSAEVIDRVREAAGEWGAALPGLTVTDTVKRVEERDCGFDVVETIPRLSLRLAQTPQGFRQHVIWEAHRHWHQGVPTDDAEVVEALGHRVVMVEGDPANRKLTTPEDILWFEWRLQNAGHEPDRSGD